ncbi:MAG: spermidine/putrescine ABC transporter substrate-binding protein, partial [Actinobacteria bacterium]|nr:spermidine/putrescine ABC transporter substrate-binding protein [Actinomycetota bacterium]
MRHPKERPLTAEGINRRQFLMRSAGAAAAIPAASAILAACGDSNGGSSGSASADQLAFATREKPATLPIRDSNPPIASELPPESGATLRLFNWDAYLNKKVLGDFEKKYDCNVEVTTFGTWDEAVAKIKSGQGDWDIYFATLDLIDRLQVEELIQPLNHDYIPNLKNVWPQFGSDPNEPFYDQGSRYSVPYALYSTGVGFRNDLVAEEDQPQNLDNPFDLLWNAKYKGKIGLYDDWGFTMAVAMARNGFTDINNATQEVIDETVDSLLEANATVNPGYGINVTYEDLPKGAFVATTAWSGDMIAAPYYGKDSAAATAPLLTYYDKGNKGLAGSDTMVVLSTSQSPVLAHLFLNHMLDEEEAFKNMGWVGYQHPQ